MPPPLLALTDIHLTFGGPPLLVDAELSIFEGDRICFVGRNGSGKSTLLKIAAGLIEPDRGERVIRQGTSISYLPQEPDLRAYATTGAYVESAFAEHDDPYRGRVLLENLGLTGDESTGILSGGEARRAALARALATAPDVLLLDEPTNHLDLPAIAWLENELKAMRTALVLISHDRRFLTHLSTAIYWLDRGHTHRLDQGFGAFEQWRDDMLEQEERTHHKQARKIAAEEHWVRYGVSGRRKRNQRRLETLQTLRAQHRSYRRRGTMAEMVQTESGSAPKLVIEAVRLSKSFGDRPIVKDFSVNVARGDRVALVGPNGAGKTTLLNMLIGTLAPDSGTVKLGAGLDIVTIDQKREALRENQTLAYAVSGNDGDCVDVAGSSRHIVGYLRDFLFTPEQVNTPVSALSGGERNRLLIARAMAKPSNLLVLDEPTNDLDLETLDLLQELLNDYEGTVLLVSHDRDFIDRVAASTIAFEGNAKWAIYAGGYSDMVAQRGEGVSARESETRKVSPEKTPRAEKPRAPQKARLSFKEKHALETLPTRIADLRTGIARLHATLNDPQAYARDPDGFSKTGARLSQAEADLRAAEDQWLELEIRREEIAGSE